MGLPVRHPAGFAVLGIFLNFTVRKPVKPVPGATSGTYVSRWDPGKMVLAGCCVSSSCGSARGQNGFLIFYGQIFVLEILFYGELVDAFVPVEKLFKISCHPEKAEFSGSVFRILFVHRGKFRVFFAFFTSDSWAILL